MQSRGVGRAAVTDALGIAHHQLHVVAGTISPSRHALGMSASVIRPS